MLACQHQLDTNKSYKIHDLSSESIFFFHTEWVNTHFVLKSNLYTYYVLLSALKWNQIDIISLMPNWCHFNINSIAKKNHKNNDILCEAFFFSWNVMCCNKIMI